MGQALTDRLTGLSAGNARGALLGAASLVVVAVALVLVFAGVPSGEVVATLLFLPVFAAGFLGGRPAGYSGAVVAALVYVALRRADLSTAGVANAGVVTLFRAGVYLIVGHVGALAQALVPGGHAGVGATRARPGRAAPPADRRRPAGQRLEPATARRPVEPAWDEPWARVGQTTPAAAALDRSQPVLAGVGSPAPGYPYAAEGAGYGDGPPTTTMSGGWPPEPAPDTWQEGPRPPRRDDGYDTGGGWDEGAGAGWQGDAGGQGWPEGDAEGQGPGAPWSGGGDRSVADDSWAAVQQSWRDQHGVSVEDDAGGDQYQTGHQGWPNEPQGHGAGGAGVGAGPADPWGQPAGEASGPADPWGQPQAPEHWTEQARGVDGWGEAAPAGGWNEAWGNPVGDQSTATTDAWGDAAPTGGTWPQQPDPAAGGAWPQQQPDPAAAGAWPQQQPDPPAAGAWPQQPDPAPGGWPPPASPSGGTWDPPPSAGEAWDAPQGNGTEPGWGAVAEDPWPSTGQTASAWADPAPGYEQPADPWSAPTEAGWAAAGAGGAMGGTFGSPSPAGGAQPPMGPPPAHAPLPSVDPETGLWTAKFLRDRLTSERARGRRSGRSFSLVLVQVPDGPLAQLPYRRQVTLLRELGYQFVAGGVVDHLIHVPDQSQHWFAVILPDTDRSGAQVLERRLRLGIGGYLSSRGLRLRDLESASLTAPDDDPAMGAIWEALIGPEDTGSSAASFDY